MKSSDRKLLENLNEFFFKGTKTKIDLFIETKT